MRLVAGPANDVRWRLLAGNGRTLGVAPAGLADAAAAEAALREVVAAAASLSASITHPESSVAWTWRALDPSGLAVAAGDRNYGRYGTCVASFDRFRRTLGALRPDDVAELLHAQPKVR